jgi:hypothetical protein
MQMPGLTPGICISGQIRFANPGRRAESVIACHTHSLSTSWPSLDLIRRFVLAILIVKSAV